jgi:hypothetical protein
MNKLSTKSKAKDTNRSSVFDPLTDTNRDGTVRRGLDLEANIRLSSLKKSKSNPIKRDTPKLMRRRRVNKLNKLKSSQLNSESDSNIVSEDLEEDYVMKPRNSFRSKSSNNIKNKNKRKF